MDNTVTDKSGTQLPSGEQAAGGRSPEWTGHPVDIRLTIPLPFRSFYVTIVAGPERRSAERRVSERAKHPLITAGNLLVYMMIGGVCGLAVLGMINLLLSHALISGSLWASMLFALLYLTGFAFCIWLVVRQPDTARKDKGASGAAGTAG